MSEFDLIQQFFTWKHDDPTLITSVGDDAAVVQLAPDEELVVSVDTLISGVHFPEETDPHAIGHKALAVNLSDLAAMGADARWFTLALTLPESDPVWLKAFAQGLRELADKAGVTLIGGDTTRGALSITIQVMGTVPRGQAVLRSGAQPGDLLVVSGTLGDGAAGLAVVQQRLALPEQETHYCRQRLDYPQARYALAGFIRQYASSCLDISDGLLADLQHILDASQVGAVLKLEQLPLSTAVAGLSKQQRLDFALRGGDDYELLFTVPPAHWQALQAAVQQLTEKQSVSLTCIGEVNPESGIIKDAEGSLVSAAGYNHFA